MRFQFQLKLRFLPGRPIYISAQITRPSVHTVLVLIRSKINWVRCSCVFSFLLIPDSLILDPLNPCQLILLDFRPLETGML